MEDAPLFPRPEDDDEEDDNEDQPKRKVPSLGELLISDEKEESDDKDGKKSILSLFEANKKSTKDDEAEPDESLSADEIATVQREVALEHLNNPVVEAEPQPPVVDFLEQVVDGIDPDTAYEATKIAYQLDEVPEQSKESITEEVATPPSNERVEIEYPHSNPFISEPEAAISSSITTVESVAPKSDTKLVNKITSSIATHRHQSLSEPKTVYVEKPAVVAVPESLKKDINDIEVKLTKKEVTLQRLSQTKQEAPASVNTTTKPVERTQQGRNESRLNLTKPTAQAEKIGRMLINNESKRTEQTVSNQIKDTAPDQVKYMSRAELLDLSSKLEVEGASLKHMFDNNLFNEIALRRLVEAYLSGKNIAPMLRHEILTKQQSKFEKDPLLRDRQAINTKTNASWDDIYKVSNQLNPHINNQHQGSIAQAESLNIYSPNSSKNQSKPHGVSVASATLVAVIIILVFLIILFTFHI